MKKYWQVFHDWSLLLRYFWSFVRSAVFLAGCLTVQPCQLANCSSVVHAIYIKSNPMHRLGGALPLPYVQAHVTCGALVAHRHLFVSPSCIPSQYHRTFVPLSASHWNDLSESVFDGVGLLECHYGILMFKTEQQLLELICII